MSFWIQPPATVHSHVGSLGWTSGVSLPARWAVTAVANKTDKRVFGDMVCEIDTQNRACLGLGMGTC